MGSSVIEAVAHEPQTSEGLRTPPLSLTPSLNLVPGSEFGSAKCVLRTDSRRKPV